MSRGGLYQVAPKKLQASFERSGWQVSPAPKQAPKEAEKVELNVTAAAKKLAAKHDIDLSTVKGTGSDGAILKSDVESLIND